MNDIKKVYFIGIGGIGMSALARYFNSRGTIVYGYDKTKTKLTEKLEAEGMHIHYTENCSAIPTQIDLVVYTPAIPETHKELVYFKKHNFLIKKRAEVLGMISRSHKTIAIGGTHGKTTTTSILTHLLKVGGVEPTAFLGGIAKNFESNYVAGNGEWIVVEADEYDRSFLQLHPWIAVVLSMDADHLDIYGKEEEVVEGFRAFAKKTSEKGYLFVNEAWEKKIGDKTNFSCEVKTYGIDKGDYQAQNVHIKNGTFVFDLKFENKLLKELPFLLPGRHNIENATVAIAIALHIGVNEQDIRKALFQFKGIGRRFEIVSHTEQTVFIDDYAHHPSELKAAINTAKELFPDRKITGVFQPHLYSRTRDFLEGFAEVLSTLDTIILLDIYPAREKPIFGITADLLFEKINSNNKIRSTKEELPNLIATLQPKVLLTLGAGDIDTCILSIKKIVENG